MSYEVEINALEKDVEIWLTAANDLEVPINSIVPLTLEGANDVMGLGSRLGIDTSYERARSMMETQMRQGIEYFNTMATALRDVAANYRQQEAASAEGFRSTQGELGEN